MNDITKEAIKQTVRSAFKEFLIRRKAHRLARSLKRSHKPLKGPFERYLTGDEGSRCDRLDVPSEANHQPIDVDAFRKFCEEIGE